MKVLMLNTFDELAGADRAARRLQQGLRNAGVDAKMLVQFRLGAGQDVICRTAPWQKALHRLKLYLGLLPVRHYPNRPENNFTPALLPDRLPAEVARINPDIVHLHWLGAGFCRIETLARFKQPLVWTLHDSWSFTGGCHVPGDCRRYREQCGACPVLGSTREDDLSRRTWLRKNRAWRGSELTVVAPSRWLAECARASSLFRARRVEVVPNGLDTETYRPMEKSVARERFDLPQDRPLILYGAVNAMTDPNKGWDLLQPALQIVSRQLPEAMLVVFGAEKPAVLPVFGMPTVFLGRLSDEGALVAANSAADVFVAPSKQESFCQTALEAMACGTPVVAFGATGLLDVVEHQDSGYLAQPYDVEDLAHGLAWVLADRDRQSDLGGRARHKAVNDFALPKVTERYLNLYRELLTAPASGGLR